MSHSVLLVNEELLCIGKINSKKFIINNLGGLLIGGGLLERAGTLFIKRNLTRASLAELRRRLKLSRPVPNEVLGIGDRIERSDFSDGLKEETIPSETSVDNELSDSLS